MVCPSKSQIRGRSHSKILLAHILHIRNYCPDFYPCLRYIMPNNLTQAEHQKQIVKVLEFVREHHQSQLSLSDLAEVASQSPFHFERVFQAADDVLPASH